MMCMHRSKRLFCPSQVRAAQSGFIARSGDCKRAAVEGRTDHEERLVVEGGFQIERQGKEEDGRERVAPVGVVETAEAGALERLPV